jgi:hypothetical protein
VVALTLASMMGSELMLAPPCAVVSRMFGVHQIVSPDELNSKYLQVT